VIIHRVHIVQCVSHSKEENETLQELKRFHAFNYPVEYVYYNCDMPLVYRNVTPRKLCSSKLELQGKYDSEFIAVNNKALVSVLRQLASLVHHATDIFSDAATLTEQVHKRIISVKLKLDELEAKSELFDPKLVPVRKYTISYICTYS